MSDRKKAIETLKENLCAMCAYGSQNMESCDIRSCDNRDAIKALDQEPTTKNETLVSLDVYKQVAWERDIAIEQLHELGYEFGQKIEPTTKNVLGVDTDKLIADCEKMSFDFELFGRPTKALLLDAVKNIVKKLPPVTPQEPRWIPISKRLPKKYSFVLVSTDANEVFIADYLGKMSDGTDCFDDDDGMMWEGDVIAWMPMPEPYIEVEE